MEFEQIKELINLVNESENISEFTLKKGQTGIEIKKVTAAQEEKKTLIPSKPEVETNSSLFPTKDTTQMSTPNKEEVTIKTEENLVKVTSPMVGTFYASSSPDAENYVSVGSKVNKSSVVCIVEAMKLFNEIQAEVDGEVVEVLVENGQLVEYGQPLFLIRPNGGVK